MKENKCNFLAGRTGGNRRSSDTVNVAGEGERDVEWQMCNSSVFEKQGHSKDNIVSRNRERERGKEV